jgi:hypothetical protein
MFIIGVISLFLAATGKNTYEYENIVEWNASLLLTLYFSGMLFIWKDYRQAFTSSPANN